MINGRALRTLRVVIIFIHRLYFKAHYTLLYTRWPKKGYSCTDIIVHAVVAFCCITLH